MIETAPEFAHWAWFTGTFQQYDATIFMLMEVYRNPGIPQAHRINVVLDHVYGNALGLTSEQRNRNTLQLLLHKIDESEQLRTTSQTPSIAFSSDVGTMTSSDNFPLYDPWGSQPMMDFECGPIMNVPSISTSTWV